ncbi:MAG: hypothetical protein ABIJ96_05180 [Elusimicrobiota bacterium]
MNGRSSIIWIIFLLAAMFLGPTVILNKMTASSPKKYEHTLRPGEVSRLDLRALIEQEKLIDAPAALPETSDDR